MYSFETDRVQDKTNITHTRAREPQKSLRSVPSTRTSCSYPKPNIQKKTQRLVTNNAVAHFWSCHVTLNYSHLRSINILCVFVYAYCVFPYILHLGDTIKRIPLHINECSYRNAYRCNGIIHHTNAIALAAKGTLKTYFLACALMSIIWTV